MKQIYLFISCFILVPFAPSSGQDTDPEALFKAKCGICHTIGGGRLVGPDLANVHDRRSEDWMMRFIKSSQAMIKSGDPDAAALFEQNNKVVMPDPMISDAEIRSILGHIAANSGAKTVAAAAVSLVEGATHKDLEHGRNLFEGRARFANGGPSCISCHNDLSTVYFSENSYSVKDISQSFSTLGEAGVKAILSSPPFPVMAKAFEGHKLTDTEVRALLIFLKNAGTNKAQPASGYLLYGILGAGTLLLLYAGFWYERKNRSVNHDIYKRQIKSFN